MPDKTLLIARLVALAVLMAGFFTGFGLVYTVGTLSLGVVIGYETYLKWDQLSPRLQLVQCLLVVMLVLLGFL